MRLDTNEIFYIGIGTSTKPNSFTIYQKYARAFTKHGRSKWWHNIVNKSGKYRIKILLESNDLSLVRQKEIEFISEYGRKDINQGLLVNLTNGGEGAFGRVFSMKEEQKEKLSDIRSKPVYCYNASTGDFYYKFKGVKEAANILKIYQNNISSAFNYSNYSSGYYFFREYKGENLGYIYDPNKPHTNSKIVYCYKNGKYIKEYPSSIEAAKDIGVVRESIRQSIKKGNMCKGFNLFHQKQRELTITE